MLSWSGHHSDVDVDLDAVSSGRGDVGIPLGAELLRFASAAAVLAGDMTEINAARRALVARAGEAAMVDAAAVVANFQMMTRLADGTGARYPAAHLAASEPTIARMGAATMLSRR